MYSFRIHYTFVVICFPLGKICILNKTIIKLEFAGRGPECNTNLCVLFAVEEVENGPEPEDEASFT